MYVVFDSPVDESIFLRDKRKLKILAAAIGEITGMECEIKTLTKGIYDSRAKGIDISYSKDKKIDRLEGKVIEDLSGIEVEIIE